MYMLYRFSRNLLKHSIVYMRFICGHECSYRSSDSWIYYLNKRIGHNSSTLFEMNIVPISLLSNG